VSLLYAIFYQVQSPANLPNKEKNNEKT